MRLFSYFDVSPRTERRIRKRNMQGVQLKWKRFEMEKKERVERYMRSLSLYDDVQAVVSECVTAVCEAEKTKKVCRGKRGYCSAGKE